ncbi:peroxidase family protein [Novosphingobium sp.]|uniref:peroxidase family protein n=1 Tax=Novosphingobium sp. TaxID=1874826 RepID=UPI00262D4EDE|nr:peroxidase family protein [Novosphingobium sp.]
MNDINFIKLQLNLPNNTPLAPVDNTGIRDVQGVGNNVFNPTWGSADQLFPRLTLANYTNAMGTFSFAQNGSISITPATVDAPVSYATRGINLVDAAPRIISNLVSDQSGLTPLQIQDNPINTNGARVSPVTGTINPLPASGFMTLFGQFFDHGLDLVHKGADGMVLVPLMPGDPLYSTAPGAFNFMVVSRTNTVNGESTNTISPYIDLSQSYGSAPSHTVFLREYDAVGRVTGRLLSGGGDAVSPLSGTLDGMATWFDVKANAGRIGITLHDINVNDIPKVRMNADGSTFFDAGGKAWLVAHDTTGVTYFVQNTHIGSNTTILQLDEETGATVEMTAGTTANFAALLGTLSLDTIGHAFLDDMAHGVAPKMSGPSGPGNVDQFGDLLQTAITVYNQDGSIKFQGFKDDLLDHHFVAGDGRANENIGLTAIHDVFHSEHNNTLADIKAMILGGTDSHGTTWTARADAAQWTNEQFFQAAKLVTEMEYQHLVFGEFVRKLSPNVNAFGGYDVSIDPAITAEFAHAVYRFGHSMLTETVDMTAFDANGISTKQDVGMLLFDAFLNPTGYDATTAGEIAIGMSNQVSNGIDEWVTDALRNNLVGMPLDLAAINMVRGRDSGIPSLNETRAQLFAQTGMSMLQPYESWDDFGMSLLHPESLRNFIMAYSRDALLSGFEGHDLAHWNALQASTAPADIAAYAAALRSAADAAMNDAAFMTGGDNGYNRVDLWLGGLAEQKVAGGMLGATFDFIFAHQMIELQAGDRFYYLDRLAGTNLLGQIEGQLFSDIVMRNSGVQHLYSDIFSVADANVEISATTTTFATATALRNANAAGWYTGTFYGNMGNYTDARGVLNPNGVGNASEMIGGTDNAEKINGMGGNDTIWGDGGNDTIEGGNGNDFLHGGAGNDILADTQGDDLMWGDDGNDLVNGGSGIDQVFGGGGNDTLYGGQGADIVDGDDGDDFIYGDSGVIANGSMDTNGDSDVIAGGAGNDRIYGGGGADVIDGGDGDDIIEGGSGNDGLIGWDGNDTFVMDEGDTGFNNTIDGGLGIDLVDYSASKGGGTAPNGRVRGIDINLSNAGLAVVPAGVAAPDTFLAVEKAIGSAYDDIIVGGKAQVTDQAGGLVFRVDPATGLPVPLLDALGAPVTDPLTGQPVFQTIPIDFTIDGGAGRDFISGGFGNDILIGGAGSDIVSYAAASGPITVNLSVTAPQATGEGTDTLTGFEGVIGSTSADTLTGSAANDVIDGGAGTANDTLTGGAGIDTVAFGSAGAGVTVNLGTTGAQNTVGAGADTITLFENIIGSAFNDTLTGDGGANVIEGGLGNDAINGGAGTDTASYEGATAAVTVNLGLATAQNTIGAGADTLTAMENLTGSGFADTLTGSNANNVIDGGIGNDVISAGSGNDTVTGGAGNDMIDGGAGSDIAVYSGNRAEYAISSARTGTKTSLVITGKEGADTLTGVEQLQFADGLFAVPTVLTTGNDTYTGTANNDLIQGLAGNDAINGAAGHDLLDGGAGSDTLNGDAGDDTLIGGAGNDILNGGAGFDTAEFGAAQSNYIIFTDQLTGATSVTDTRFGGDGVDVLTGVEMLRFSDQTVILPTYLTAGNDIYTGGAADETIFGLDGSDTINGAAGADTLYGGLGNDTLDGGAGSDTLAGGLGNDTYIIDSSADVIVELSGEGTDLVQSTVSLTLLSNLENLTLTGAAAIDGIGNSLANTLTGNSANNVLNGGAGNDRLIGGLGIDTAVFSSNAASYSVTVDTANASVVVTGIDGVDTLVGMEQLQFADQLMSSPVILTAGNDTYSGTANGDIIFGLAGSDTINGLGGNDMIDGGDGANTLNGGDGDDTLVSGAGNDIITGGAGVDTISYAGAATAVTVNLSTTGQQNTGGNGRDTITAVENVTGSALNDTLTGNGSANRLSGGAGNDALNGGAGNDTLVGGLGNDTLTGGAGQDFIVFDTAPGATNRDTISGFVTVDDTIHLDDAVFAAVGSVGNLSAGAFAMGTAAAQADDRIIYNSANGGLLYDPDGLGGVAAIQFATITGLTGALSASDFVII